MNFCDLGIDSSSIFFKVVCFIIPFLTNFSVFQTNNKPIIQNCFLILRERDVLDIPVQYGKPNLKIWLICKGSYQLA